MPDTGFNWDDAWAATEKTVGGTADWTNIEVPNAQLQISSVIDMDGKVAIDLGMKFVGPGSGSVTGTLRLSIIGDVDGTNFEDPNLGNNSNSFVFEVEPVVADAKYKHLVILAAEYSRFKFQVNNESGILVNTTIKQKFCTVPPAS